MAVAVTRVPLSGGANYGNVAVAPRHASRYPSSEHTFFSSNRNKGQGAETQLCIYVLRGDYPPFGSHLLFYSFGLTSDPTHFSVVSHVYPFTVNHR
jgi:hypothetical protein